MAKRNSSEEVKLTQSDEDIDMSEDENMDISDDEECSQVAGNAGDDPGSHVHCTFCGNEVKFSPSNGSKLIQCQSCGTKESESQTGTCSTASGTEFVQGLPNLPDSTLEDTISIEETENTSRTSRTVRNESEPRGFNQFQRVKIPEEGTCDFTRSVQNPHTGPIRITIFLMERHYRYPDIQTYDVYFVPFGVFQQVYEKVRIAEGYHPLPLGYEHLRSLANDYIHEVLVDEEVKVSFQMTNHSRGKFRIRYPLIPKVISSDNIRSKCHSRISPGAKAELCVECLGDPGEICQGEVRVIIEKGRLGTQKMVFPIWGIR